MKTLLTIEKQVPMFPLNSESFQEVGGKEGDKLMNIFINFQKIIN